ncbi:class I SAM-dependent methyltransferase [Acidimangrovimonas pyrenivorans]|uniref:Class I SAM-dependent methyltransferase n=1 Tax=Acidimangrovimonas pyrenivorans TaxID=2030798 RepID=A0ABV7AIH6_9RHOB
MAERGGDPGPGDIPATYGRQAKSWDAGRSRALFERRWLDRMSEGFGPGATILDLGCGGGEPIADYLLGRDFALTGVDIAPEMLELARRRFPRAEWIEADMRGLALGRRFDAVLAWNSFFHLDPAAQRAMFAVFSALLAPGGRLLFTTGPAAGIAIGRVGDEQVYHSSLSPAQYAALIEANGMAVRAFVAQDPDCAGHSVWLARRAA